MSVLGRAVVIWKAGQGTGDVLARPAVHDRAIRGWVSCVKLTSCQGCVGGADFVTAGGCDSGSRISFSVGRDRTTGFAEDETAGGVLMSECHSRAVRETGAIVCARPDRGKAPRYQFSVDRLIDHPDHYVFRPGSTGSGGASGPDNT